MKKKILAYACDHNYFDYTKVSFASFCEHHHLAEWEVIFGDVGLSPEQATELSHYGTVMKYEPSRRKIQDDVIIPSARARLAMLSDLVDDDAMLLYLDSDTLIFENLDALVSEFVRSGKPVGAFFEDIDEFGRPPASYAWRDHDIPRLFCKQDRWRNAPMVNAGVLLAQGAQARAVGEAAVALFDEFEPDLWLAEQTILVSLLYDCEIPCFRLPVKYNCVAWEKHIVHVGSGRPYVATRPYFRGEPVAIRHFAWSPCKGPLREALPMLAQDSNRVLVGIPSKTTRADSI